MRGKVTRFDPDRGIGSIVVGDVPARFIVRIDDVSGQRCLVAGQQVQFDVVMNERELRAANVKPKRKGPKPWITHTFLAFALVLTLAVVFAVAFGLHWLLAWFSVVSMVTTGFYAWDKDAAAANTARVPERTLHLLEAAGGSLGAVVARQGFRHKTRKRPFLLRSWTILAAQVLIAIGYVRRFGFDLPL